MVMLDVEIAGSGDGAEQQQDNEGDAEGGFPCQINIRMDTPLKYF
jgi:hypothetical protein